MNIWAIREKSGLFEKASREPVQLTAGPMSFTSLLPSRDGKKLFAIGTQARGELAHYDSKLRQFTPYLSGISAVSCTGSRLALSSRPLFSRIAQIFIVAPRDEANTK